MHNFICNASIQMLPVQSGTTHPYAWVDEVVYLIEQSGLPYTVTAFNTVVDGTFEQLHALVATINHCLQEKNCTEWILQVQYQVRGSSAITSAEKTEKFS